MNIRTKQIFLHLVILYIKTANIKLFLLRNNQSFKNVTEVIIK